MVTGHNPQEVVNIIYVVIKKLRGRVSDEELELMVGTAATESRLYQRVQIGGGPARGVFQMEPDTATDLYINYLSRKPDLYSKMMDIVFGLGNAPFFVPEPHDIDRLLTLCDDYAALLTRFGYLRRKPPIPTTLEGQARYYKRWHNTEAGAGSPEKYITDWYDCDCTALLTAYVD